MGRRQHIKMLGSKGLNFHYMFSSLTAYLASSAEICGTSMPILWTVTLLRVCRKINRGQRGALLGLGSYVLVTPSVK